MGLGVSGPETLNPVPKIAAGPGHAAKVPYPVPEMAAGPDRVAELPYPVPEMAAVWSKSHTLCPKRPQIQAWGLRSSPGGLKPGLGGKIHQPWGLKSSPGSSNPALGAQIQL